MFSISISKMYDVYLFIGSRTLPELDELIQSVPALADPVLQKKILQRSPGPGFLKLDLAHDVATTLLQVLQSRKANGSVVLSAYRQPKITREQAEALAKRVLAELHATRIPIIALGPFILCEKSL